MHEVLALLESVNTLCISVDENAADVIAFGTFNELIVTTEDLKDMLIQRRIHTVCLNRCTNVNMSEIADFVSENGLEVDLCASYSETRCLGTCQKDRCKACVRQ